MPETITAIILTHDEERHIARCIRSLRHVVNQLVVIDSFSTDRTVEIAKALGAEVMQNAWVNYATQFNWALDHAPIRGTWCLRIDADEYLTDALRDEIRRRIIDAPPPDAVTGAYVSRLMCFAGTPIRWGACYPVRMLRLFRRGMGRCEQRWMDEHILLARGSTLRLSGDLVDDNLNNLGWWTAKHNGYATREAIDILCVKHGLQSVHETRRPSILSQEGRKRLVKEQVYARLPGGFRAALYFTYRYVFRLGVLDGRRGWSFHFLQGFWYRVLVDAKVAELEQRARASHSSLSEVIGKEYGIELGTGAGHPTARR